MPNAYGRAVPAIGWNRAGVLALVPDDWSVAWQRRHQILSRLARYCPVAWISPALHWRARLSRFLHRQPHSVHHREPIAQFFALASADDVPTVNAPRALRQAIVRRRASRGARWLHGRGCRAIELQIWLPEFARALDWIPHTTSSYHIDDEYSWSTVDLPLSTTERRLIERVDRVYVTAPKLLERKGGINPRTIFLPNGVDYAAFSTPAPEPRDLARIPRPRVGYVGVLKEQLDWELLTTLAKVRSDWSFVLVGPIRTGHQSLGSRVSLIASLPNVHLLGERSIDALPGYVQALDVALMPYRKNAYTDCINPLKLYEALAAGIPIVSSRLRTVEEFGSVVRLAESTEDWIAGITHALSDSSPLNTQRQTIARAHDWDTIVAAMAASIADGLDRALPQS